MTSLEKTVTEICLRAAAKVYEGSTPAHLDGIAEPAREMLMELIIIQEKGGIVPPCILPTQTYGEWKSLNDYMDEIGKEIPIADKVDIVGPVSRFDRLAYEKAQKPIKRVAANLSGDGKQPEIKETKRGRKPKGSNSQA